MPGRWLAGVLSVVHQWRRRAQARRILETMDERMLKDIGITRDDARREANLQSWWP